MLLAARSAELALSVGQEAGKLNDPVEVIQIQLEAARLLAKERPEDALRVLNLALLEVRDCPISWKSKEKQSKSFQLLRLRGEILALYATIDQQKAGKLLKSLPNCSVKGTDSSESERSDRPVNWDARHRADELVKVGVNKLGENPTAGIGMILSSVSSTGKISEALSDVVKKLRDTGNDQLADEIEKQMAELIASQTSSDAFDHQAVATLIASDPRMSAVTRQVFSSYLLRGLESFVSAIKESQVSGLPLQIDSDNLGYLYCEYLQMIRRVIEKYSPDKSEYVNAALQQIATVLPEKWLDSASRIPIRLTPEQASQQLEHTLEITDSDVRDSRLTNFALQALAGLFSKEEGLKLAATAIDAIRDSELRTILKDYFLMAETRAKIEKDESTFAEEKANSIVNPEWRAWSLMAVGYALSKQDGNAVQLYESTSRILEKSSPTPRRVEIAFKLAELWSERDPQRAFEVLTRAIAYANQDNKPDANQLIEKHHLSGFYSVIGKLDLQPANEPTSISDLKFGEGIKRMSQFDWGQTEFLSRKIQALPLRLRFQLAMCQAAL